MARLVGDSCVSLRLPLRGARLDSELDSGPGLRIPRALARAALLAFSVALLVVLLPGAAEAHTPHVDVARAAFDGLLGGRCHLLAVVRENLWLSAHGGDWIRLWRGLPHARVRDVALAPGFTDEGRAAAATDHGLHYTIDHGATWRRAQAPDGCWPEARALSLALAPAPEARLAAAARSADMACIVDGAVLVSDDAGASWERLATPAAGRATAAAGVEGGWRIGFADGFVWQRRRDGSWSGPWTVGASVTSIVAESEDLAFAATDGAGVWRLGPKGAAACLGLAGLRTTSLAALHAPDWPGGGLAATTWREGVHVHALGGEKWELRKRGLTREAQADQEPFRAPHFREVVAASRAAGGEELLVAGFDGLFRSSDYGKHWRRAPTGLSTDIVAGVAEGEAGGVVLSLYGGGARAIALREGGAVSARAALRSVRTFAVARAPRGTGASETWVVGHDFVYALGPDGAVLRQARLGAGEGAGSSPLLGVRRRLIRPIKRAVGGLPPALRDPIRAAVVSRGGAPGLEIRVTGFGSQIAIPQDFDRTGAAFVSTWRHGLFRTVDHGRTFQLVWTPEDGAILNDVAVFPRYAACPLLAAATETGLRTSEDGGLTWRATAVDASVIRTAVGPGPRGRPIVFAATWTELLRCERDPREPRDWVPVLDCPGAHAVTEIALAPDFAESGLALVNVAGRGLVRSTDWGAGFAPCRPDADGAPPESSQLVSFPDSARTTAFSSAFARDRIVWAAAGTTLRRSDDGGLTWRRIAHAEEEGRRHVL